MSIIEILKAFNNLTSVIMNLVHSRSPLDVITNAEKLALVAELERMNSTVQQTMRVFIPAPASERTVPPLDIDIEIVKPSE